MRTILLEKGVTPEDIVRMHKKYAEEHQLSHGQLVDSMDVLEKSNL